MAFSIQRVKIANAVDEGGMLLFDEQGSLTAVAVKLDEEHEENAGRLFIEATFGGREALLHQLFEDESTLISALENEPAG